MDKMMSETLDLMIKHNSMFSTNIFLLKHLGVTWDEFKNLPKTSTVCKKHFEENCAMCKKYLVSV
jgi:hypothetical protein